MKIVFTERKAQVTSAMKEYAEKKINKLEKFFRDESEAFVTFGYERGRYEAEITLRNNGLYFRVSEKTNDMRASIDSAVAAIERQIRKNKTKLAKKVHSGAIDQYLIDFPEEEPAAEEMEAEPEYRVVRTKHFFVKPLSVDEAILQMNMLDHQFFMFRNESSGEINVVYRRKNGDYGLLEPDAE